jgi:glycosyltransferase involved in cell wall biosynthesis
VSDPLPTHRPSRPIVAFVGAVIPDEPEYHGPAFNRAGQLFQRGLLDGLTAAGLPPDTVFSIQPIGAFPKVRRIWVPGGRFALGGGIPVRLLPFVNIHPLKWLTAGIMTFGSVVRWSWIHRRRQRIVHLVNLTMPPALFVLLAARLTGACMLISVLDVFRPGSLVPDTIYHRLDFALQRWLLPHFDGWMVVSQAIAEDLVPGQRVCRIEGGIKAELFGEPPLPRPGGSPFRMVLAGGIEPYNGVDLLLEALRWLPADCEIVLAGTGALTDDVVAAARRDRRVVYRGFLTLDEVLELYRSADLLLNLRVTKALDTRYFFPSKLMEYLASGVPVLSTCTGHVEEEYGAYVYLLRDETPEALADAISTIRGVAPAERRALGLRAREYMLATKTWPKQGERLVAYIREFVLRTRG